ncbi:hypothetical protein L1987_15080 [Smallanthus sonchifolius]|uniref:Uncharacterized protein n=1 Tax=Smallanthus sonchifolius TaxID=185202 RepID=A0ACB9J646_9ASTR|nr:hypothetical protein L1987_15080 [Smallanthus sonchifolius]
MASSSSSDFIEEDEFRVEILSSILDPITIERVRVASEVSEDSTSQSADISSADSHVEEPITPMSSVRIYFRVLLLVDKIESAKEAINAHTMITLVLRLQSRMYISLMFCVNKDLVRFHSSGASEIFLSMILRKRIFLLRKVFKSDHNICACLDVHAPNCGNYLDLIKYLKHSMVYFAHTINLVIYEVYIRQFGSSVEVTEVSGVSMIKAIVNDQDILISDDTIRTHRRFNDTANDPTTLSPDVVIQTFRRMAYEELEETLGLAHLNPRVFVNMKKNHSRSTFSGNKTPLFPEMMGFEDIESGAESSSLGSSSDMLMKEMIIMMMDKMEMMNMLIPILSLTMKNSTQLKIHLLHLLDMIGFNSYSQFKKEKKRLELSKSSSKPRKLRRLVRGPPPQPSYKNIVVSSNTSSEGDAESHEEKDDEEVFYFDGDNAGISSPADDDVAGPSSPMGENILSSSGSPIKNLYKGKQIVIKDEFPQVTSTTKLTKEMEEELSRQAIVEILRKDDLDAKAQADVEIAKAAAESLSSILSKQLEKKTEFIKERMNVHRKIARVYPRRKETKDEKLSEDVSKESETTPKVVQDPVIPKSTPRKKSIPKRVLKKLADWEEIFGMSMNNLEDSVQEIKSKMTKEELERDSLNFYLKANNHRSKQPKNMKTENLKKLVTNMKSEKKKEKKILLDKELEKTIQKDEVINKEKEKENPKEKSGRESEKALRDRLSELEKAKKRRLEVGSKVSKEIYSSYAAEAPIKVSAESKATWFKKKPEISSRLVDNFENKGKTPSVGEDIFKLSVADLNVLAGIKMLTTHPKVYDFEKLLRSMSKDRFHAYKKNPKVTRRKMSRFRYDVQNVVARKNVRSKAPTTILPHDNEEYTKNYESLQWLN